MKDIPMIRIFRYFLAVMISLFFVANVLSNEARASDTGTVTIEALSDRSYSIGGANAAEGTAWTSFTWDSSTYNYISWFRINDSGTAYSLGSPQSNSRFECTSGCTGGGYAYYNQVVSGDNVTWVFDSSAIFTSSPVVISYTNTSFSTTIVHNPVFTHTPIAAASATQPVHFRTTGLGSEPTIDYVVEASVRTTNDYNATWFTTGLGLQFNLTVTKGNINTGVNVTNAVGQIITAETTLNNDNYSIISVSNGTGLGLNISIAGGYTSVVINSTGFSIPTPPFPGSGGSSSQQLSYNFDDDAIGETYGFHANISTENFTSFTTFYIYAYDANRDLITGFPIDFSVQNFSTGKFWSFNESGIYNASLKYCGTFDITCSNVLKTGLHDLDNATIYIPPASYNFSITTDATDYQPGDTINIIATNPSPEPAYLTAFGETGIITDIAWNTLIPAGQSAGLRRVIPSNMPMGEYILILATTQSYYPIVAQETFNISSPGNTTNTLSALWGESLYLVGKVGTLTTTSNFNTSTLTITSPGGTTLIYSFPANSTNYTLVTLNDIGIWTARIVDIGNSSNFSQSNTTVSAGNPTDNETVELCKSSTTFVCWDKKTYTQGDGYVISFQLKPKLTDVASLNPYLEITNPNGKVIYNKSINITYSSSQNAFVGSISNSFSPQAITGLYFARLININVLGETEIRAESAAELEQRTVTTTPSATGGDAMQTQTDNFLSSGMFIVFIMLLLFAGAGWEIGGFGGAVIGFSSGFIFTSVYGLMPLWALFLFAIVVIVAFAVFMGDRITGGGGG